MSKRQPYKTQIAVALSSLVTWIGLGTIFYHGLENWSWIKSFYFSVTTLTTVGFGDLVPTTDASRLFTAFYILIGVGIVLASLTILGTRYMHYQTLRVRREEEKIKKKFKRK